MAYEKLQTFNAGDSVTVDFLNQVGANDEALNALIGPSTVINAIPNPSFETYTGTNNIADNWVFYPYPGGTAGLNTTTAQHGSQCMVITSPGGSGNGGGGLVSDLIAASDSPGLINSIGFFMITNNAALHCAVYIGCYDGNKNQLANAVVYDSQANPTAWTYMVLPVPALPAGTRFITVQFYGGIDDVNQAGSMSVDGVILNPAPAYCNIGYPVLVTLAEAVGPWSTIATTPTEVAAFRALRNGTLYVNYELWRSSGTGEAYGQIYKNGTALFTPDPSVINTPTSFPKNIQVTAGDLLQLYLWVSSGTANAQNFTFQSATWDIPLPQMT